MTAQKDIAEAEFDDHGYQELRANAYSLIAHLLSAAPNAVTLDRLLGITSTEGETAKDGSGSLAPAWRALRDAATEAEPEQLAREYHGFFIGRG